MLFNRVFTSKKPLSIVVYGVMFFLISLIFFGSLDYHAISEITNLQKQAENQNIKQANEEMAFTISQINTIIRDTGKAFSQWDETSQQINNPTYYSYWRENRIKTASFLPEFPLSVEIYNSDGKALATPIDPNLEKQLTLPVSNSVFLKKAKSFDIYHYEAIIDSQINENIIGYIGLRVNFLEALNAIQRFKFINSNTIGFEKDQDEIVDIKNITAYLNYELVEHIEFNLLQTFSFEILQRFSLLGTGLSLLFIALLTVLFVLPSRRLSKQIDALHQGTFNFDGKGNDKFPIAELEKVRQSLNNYHRELLQRDLALRNSEMLMRSVLDNVVDGIITIDESREIESYNPAVNNMFNLNHRELKGVDLTSLFDEDSRLEFIRYFTSYLHQSWSCKQHIETSEFIACNNDNTRFPIEINLSKMEIVDRTLFIVVIRDITERKRAEEKLMYLANFDELTGLPNRTLVRDRLSNCMARSERDDYFCAIIFIDLDTFKSINDTLGHDAGDQLLIEAADRLKKCVREVDTVARLGGDEFMLVLDEIHQLDEITEITLRILRSIEKPVVIQKQEIFTTASIGITVYPEDSMDIDVLIKNADTAMYRAKANGGNIYQYFTAEMNVRNQKRLTYENALRHALSRSEFYLHYQPRFDLHQNKVIGMEALLRWNNDELGEVQPVTFVCLLEDTGLIIEVGEWVLRNACQQALIWHQQGNQLRLSVNLSTRQFRQKNLVSRFQQVLEETGFPASCLELEITESILIENIDIAIATLKAFSSMGIKISVDDFGTGYSSLSYLKRFPIDYLKIDKSFVSDLPDDLEDAAITRAIVALARSLNLHVTAEGIETAAQLEFIRELGCDEVQGFYFSKPLDHIQFEQYIQNKVKKFVA